MYSWSYILLKWTPYSYTYKRLVQLLHYSNGAISLKRILKKTQRCIQNSNDNKHVSKAELVVPDDVTLRGRTTTEIDMTATKPEVNMSPGAIRGAGRHGHRQASTFTSLRLTSPILGLDTAAEILYLSLSDTKYDNFYFGGRHWIWGVARYRDIIDYTVGPNCLYKQ